MSKEGSYGRLPLLSQKFYPGEKTPRQLEILLLIFERKPIKAGYKDQNKKIDTRVEKPRKTKKYLYNENY